MNKSIFAADAPAALGPYCHAKLAGNMLYTSGQTGINPATGELAGDVVAQARQALENIGVVLAAAGMGYGDVVKTLVFLTDMADFAAINAVYGEFFPSEPPARSCVAVKALPKNGSFEIEVIAAK